MGNAIQARPFPTVSAQPQAFRIPADPGILAEEVFLRNLHLEQRRTERSRRPFILLLMEARADADVRIWQRVHSIVAAVVRETDIRGWYEQDSVLGVIFTEVATESNAVREVLLSKLSAALLGQLTAEQARQITFSFCAFPDDWDKLGPGGGVSSSLYPEAGRGGSGALFAKRMLDVVGSLAALVAFAPLFAVFAAIVKLTSKGPILFRQQRVGQYGQTFTFLKFRSMYTGSDTRVHEEYVKNMISGSSPNAEDSTDKAVFKLKNDPRITPIGAWLRKTSMDELPQFLNVLRGEMALVGPRPPIPYEVAAYDIWHRRRLLEVKPGITGLWQVTGRSRTTFDDMVRLDLQYAKSWSFWTDVKLLLMTPRAIILGDGAR